MRTQKLFSALEDSFWAHATVKGKVTGDNEEKKTRETHAQKSQFHAGKAE